MIDKKITKEDVLKIVDDQNEDDFDNLENLLDWEDYKHTGAYVEDDNFLLDDDFFS